MKKIAEINQQLSDLRNKNDKQLLENKISELNNKVIVLEKEKINNSITIGELNENINLLKNKIKDDDAKIRELKNNINEKIKINENNKKKKGKENKSQ